MKKSERKLKLRKETIADLRQVAGGGEAFTYWCSGTQIDDTVYRPAHSEICQTATAPIQA
jgi:hypothetical protein